MARGGLGIGKPTRYHATVGEERKQDCCPKSFNINNSDLVAVTGERGKPMPIVIGHEAAGIVVELGGGVTGIVPQKSTSAHSCAELSNLHPKLSL